MHLYFTEHLFFPESNLFIFLLQVIHLWFEEFALEDTQLCMSDFITLRDSLGTIGTNLLLQV